MASGEIAMVVVLACLILGIAPVTIYLWRLSQRRAAEARVRPRLRLTKWGRVMEAEGFPDYVARQVGFGSLSDCPSLGSLASDYLREGKDCEANIYTFIVNASDIPEPKMLCQKFIDELDKCILGYFGFHWSHAAFLMNQVMVGCISDGVLGGKGIILQHLLESDGYAGEGSGDRSINVACPNVVETYL